MIATMRRTAMHDLHDIEAEIRSRGGDVGLPCTLLESVDSTNDEAKRSARSGAPHGSLWVAETQTNGRGRQGRAWVSPRGEGLTFSVLLRAPMPLERLPLISLAAGLAVRDAIARVVIDEPVLVKWPNDVVVGGKKIAGILAESIVCGGRAEAVVVGVGINVHTRQFPAEIADRATSVALCQKGATVSSSAAPNLRAAILADTVHEIGRNAVYVVARGLGLIHARLVAADALRGAFVSNGSAGGVAAGIDLDGRLIVRDNEGNSVFWNAGEVHLGAKHNGS